MKIMICCFAILSIIGVGAPAQAQNWELYDHFKGGFFNQGFIDPDKWGGFVYPSAFAPALFRGENGMELQFGRLRIHNHDYTGPMAGVSPTIPLITLEQTLYLGLDYPEGIRGINGLKATLNVLRTEAFSPQACLPQTFPYTASRARVFGAFFQTTMPLPSAPYTPAPVDVYAFILVERAASSSDPFYILNVKGSMGTGTHASGCNPITTLVFPFQIGTVHLWENFDLSIYWDDPNSQFIYQLNHTKVYVPYNQPPYSLNLVNLGPPLFAQKAIGAINFFTSCADQEAYMDVYFDNVQVSRK